MGRSSRKDVNIKDAMLRGLLTALSGNVRQLRERSEMTQQDLAVKASISINTVGEIEQGRVENITLATITSLTRALSEKDPLKLLK